MRQSELILDDNREREACVTRPLVEIAKIGAFSTFNERKSLD